MFDAREVNTHFTEPTLLCGRFVGAGASVPVAIANVKESQSTKTTLARSGVGALTLTFLDVPIGVYQNYDFWVVAPAADKNVRVTPIAVGSNVFTLQVTTTSTGAAVDVAATEELHFEIWASRSQVP